MTCPVCGTKNPPQAKFCLECGTSLAAPASQESRRTVTVLFADMVGFTSLGESIDQESLRRVMDRFYAEMRTAIEAESGTLAKFIGDAVLAVWGTPEVREDDALRAVRAADGMRSALAGLNEDLQSRWGVRVGMRTGVNTGEVVVDPARPADLLVGDTLNVAARLEQAAADGEVLVGPETYRLVRDDMTLEAVAPLALKGKAKPLPAWRVIDAHRPEQRSTQRLQAPLVGRSDELALLGDAFRGVAEARACRMTTVIGSPGLGKTRLVAEFVRSVSDQAIVLHGRCQATGEGITFQPVAEVLRAAAAIEDDDPPDTAREKLSSVLPADEPDGERIIERAAALLGLAPVASTEETFWAMRRILEALARERPVVLVHDDIHWGQPTFLDLLEHFVQWIRDAPVLVLALARPELREVRPALAEPGGIAEVIGLEPLDAAASRAMVTGLLGASDLPEGLAQRVLETTEGNPLFLGETLRMLADEGVLRREGDTWVAGDAADVTVPPTINALLSARIQRLDAEERSVVERAAVIGHSFYRGAVAELAPPAVKPSVDGALETLSRKELVRPEDEWWLDEQVFRFHHVLIRDAAYRSLLKEARAELHERFAAWLETKAGELAGEHEEVIAFHLEQAHAYRLELGPLDEAGRALAARAAARLHSAGNRALAREDLPAAANLLRRALVPLAGDLAGRARVLVDLAEARLSAGDTAAAEEVVEKLGLAAEELGDERLRAWSVVFATQLDNLTGAGHVRASADAAARAAQTLADAKDHAGEAKAHQVVAQAEALLGQVAAAEAALDRALVAARLADDRRRITAVLSGAPRAALWGPAPIVRASGRCLDVVRILRMTPGNRHVEAAALRCQAVLEAMRGRADAARGILDTCRTTLEELGLTLELHETAAYAGIVELLAGEPAAAEEHLRRAEAGFRVLGVEAPAAQAAALLARALLEQGRDEEALAATELAEAAGGEDLKTHSTWLGARAEVLARRGEHQAALDLAELGVQMTEPTDALADKADALMALAAVARAAGDETTARDAAARARELYAAKDHTVGVARAEAIAGAAPSAPDTAPVARADAPAAAGTAARIVARLVALHAARDYDAMETLYDESFLLVDTRELGWEPMDRATLVANQRSIAEIGADYTFATEVLAATDKMVAGITRISGTTPEGAGWDFSFGAVQLATDVNLYCEIYDADEAAVIARFDELSGLAPTVAPRSPEIAWARWMLTYNTRDWVAMRATLADDYRLVDHRHLGWEGITGAEAYVEFMRSTTEAIPDVTSSVRTVFARTDRVIAGLTVTRAHGEDGGEAELPLAIVLAIGNDGRILSGDNYEPDDEAGIRQRFAELTGAQEQVELPPLLRIANREWAEAFAAHDWDRLADFYAPDVILRDHRQGIRNEAQGRRAVVATLREVAPINGSVVRWELLAVPAPNVVVVAHALGGDTDEEGGQWEMVIDQVVVYDRDMRIALIEIFDDRAALLARGAQLGDEPLLDERPRDRAFALAPWVADDETIEPCRVWVAALNAHAVEQMAAPMTPDFCAVDHRPGIRHTIDGRDEVLGIWRWLFDTVPDVRLEAIVLTATPAAALLRLDFTSQTSDYEIGIDMLCELRDGLTQGAEMFEVGDPAAIRRFEELAAGEPRAVRLARGWEEAFNTRDWERGRATQSPDYRNEERRPLTAQGGDGADGIAQAKAVVEVAPDATWTYEVLEADGDAALLRYTVAGHGAGGSEFSVTLLHLLVADRHGTARTFSYDEDQLADAQAEYRAWNAHLRQARFQSEVLTAHDWERAATELFAEDFVQHDRREVGAPPIRGGREYAEHMGEAFSLAPDTVAEVEVHAVAGDHRVSHLIYSGHMADGGGDVVLDLWTVTQIDGLQNLRSDLYATREEAEAALAAVPAQRPIDPELAGMTHRWADAFNGRDWAAHREMLHDDALVRDHRTVAMSEARGADETMAIQRGLIDVAPDVRITQRLLAAEQLGGGVGVVAAISTYSGGGEGPMEVAVGLVLVTRDGRTAVSESYDPDPTRVLARYDAWRSHLAQAEKFVEVIRARDLDRLRDELVHPQFSQTDHRGTVAAPRIENREGMVATIATLFEESDDIALELVVREVDGPRRVARMAYRGHAGDGGGEFEVVLWAAAEMRDGKLLRSDLHPDEASARAALRAGGSDPHARHVERYAELYQAATFEQALADLYSPDLRLYDHRPISTFGTELGYEGLREQMSSMATTMDTDDATLELLEARGPWRLARTLVRGTIDGSHTETETFYVTCLDEDGRVVETHLYADLASARRHWAGAGAVRLADGVQPTDATRALQDFLAAIAARDAEAIGALFVPDFRHDDHRPGMRHDLTGGEAITRIWTGQLAEVPDLVCDAELLRSTDTVIHFRLRFSSASRGFEIDQEQVSVIRAGRAASADIYETGDPAAVQRFAALTAPSLRVEETWIAAVNAHDVEAIAACFAPGFALEDHRPLVRHNATKADVMENWERGFKSVPDLSMEAQPLGWTEHAMIALYLWRSSTQQYEIDSIGVGRCDDTGILRSDIFDVGDPAAWERFREYAGDEPLLGGGEGVEAAVPAGNENGAPGKGDAPEDAVGHGSEGPQQVT